MAGFADLVPRAQPALYGGGLNASGTEGATWLWPFVDVTDADGAAIDLTAVTGECKILTAPGGNVVATLVFTGAADGSFTLSLDEADTAGLYGGTNGQAQVCYWYLTLTDGTDEVVAWGPSNSKFRIFQGA